MDAGDLAAGVRTVITVDDHFHELRTAAADVADRIGVGERGYFSSKEDEETRGLLISYWQSRNALFDLITDYRHDEDLSDELRPQAFLVAFSAALLLVDAARFVRDFAERRPVVRRKFNEPAPQFGVPGGTYDIIQKSLLSTRHGWHLFHAIRYFRREENRLRAIAQDTGLSAIVGIIDRLHYHMDVPIAQFAKAKMRTRSAQVSRRVARSLFGRSMYGIQKLGGILAADKYLRPGHRPALPSDIAIALQKLLRPGDVLIVRKEHALTNYFLPGYWPHAALYLGTPHGLAQMGLNDHAHVEPRWAQLLDASLGGKACVLEATKDGVRIRPLDSPFGSDSVLIIRPRLADREITDALARCLHHEGKPYDFNFDFSRADRLVCTEVVYRAYDGMGSIEMPLTRRAGRLTLSGSDLVEMAVDGEQFEPIAVYAPAFGPNVVTGDEADRLIRRCQAGEQPDCTG